MIIQNTSLNPLTQKNCGVKKYAHSNRESYLKNLEAKASEFLENPEETLLVTGNGL